MSLAQGSPFWRAGKAAGEVAAKREEKEQGEAATKLQAAQRAKLAKAEVAEKRAAAATASDTAAVKPAWFPPAGEAPAVAETTEEMRNAEMEAAIRVVEMAMVIRDV